MASILKTSTVTAVIVALPKAVSSVEILLYNYTSANYKIDREVRYNKTFAEERYFYILQSTIAGHI